MSETIRRNLKEVRAIAADISAAQIHPSAFNRPDRHAPLIQHFRHMLLVAAVRTGERAGRNLERKSPQWPFQADTIEILGYGIEKVAYKLSDSNDTATGPVVLSVYHRESFRNSHEAVIRAKKATYATYQHYFGELVLPTAFAVVDNPWGDGGKPASIQPFIPGADRLSNYTPEELTQWAHEDPDFATDLDLLVTGYQHMLEAGLCPDFANSNVVISESRIALFDTGTIYNAAKVPQYGDIHRNYKTIETLSG